MNLGVILQGLKTGVRLEFIEALHDWLTQKIFLFNEHTIPFVEVDTRIVCTHKKIVAKWHVDPRSCGPIKPTT